MPNLDRQNVFGAIKYFVSIGPNEITDAFNELIDNINAINAGAVTVAEMDGGNGATSNTFWRGDGHWNQVAFTNLSGSITVSQMNSGTAASATTYWRGDGIWHAVAFSDLTGNISVSQMNNGTSAGGTTFWRGDSTWAAPAFSNLSGNIAVSQMNSGSGASSSNWWRGDGSWAAPAFTNITGNIAVSQMNSGTSAGSTTFWRGDSTWAAPAFSNLSGNIATSQMNSGTGAGVNTFFRGDGAWSGLPVILHDGRLTLTAGVPVLTSTVTAATAVYYSPYIGQFISIYDGNGVNPYNFLSGPTDTTGLTLTLGSNWLASTIYDVFATISGGVPVLATVAWTSGTARATALAQYGGQLTNGASATARTTNSVTITMAQYQGTYLGSIRISATPGQVNWTLGSAASGGGAAVLNVTNYYNRVRVITTVTDSGTTYTYSSATVRQARASTTNQLSWLCALIEDPITVAVYRDCSVGASPGFCQVGVGLNSITVFNNKHTLANAAAGAAVLISTRTSSFMPILGLNYVAALEAGDGSTTTTFARSSIDTLDAAVLM